MARPFRISGPVGLILASPEVWSSIDDPHIAGGRSSFGVINDPTSPNPTVITPTGRTAHLFAERDFGVNGYYMWFGNYDVQGGDLSQVTPNKYAGAHSLYFEVKAADRTKLEFHRFWIGLDSSVWFFVLNIDLLTGAFNTTPSASTATQFPYDPPPIMPDISVESIGDDFWGVTIEFDSSNVPDAWFVSDPSYKARYLGGFECYFWLVDNVTGLWDHAGEVRKGYYVTVPSLLKIGLV